MKFVIRSVFIAAALCWWQGALCQPFSNEIAAFKKQDSLQMPPAGKVVFAGSSSFRMWTDVQSYFPQSTIIIRGFGGARLSDLIRYVNETILVYQPGQVVIYCGENDIADSAATAGQVLQKVKTLYRLIRAQYKRIPIIYVSIKPSPSRWRLHDTMTAANALVRKYLRHRQRARFVNVWNAMLGPDGKPEPSLFREDNLHMNAKGYAIWKKLLEPYLLKD